MEYTVGDKIECVITAATEGVRHKVGRKTFCTIGMTVPVILFGENVKTAAVLDMYCFCIAALALVNNQSQRLGDKQAACIGYLKVIISRISSHCVPHFHSEKCPYAE